MSLESKVADEHPALKGKKRDFDIAHWLGVAGSYVGSAAMAYFANASTGRPYLSAALGASVGDYLRYEAGFTPYWYLKNTNRYKGLKGKAKFAKDWTSFTVKSIPVEIGTYLLNIPAAIAGTYLTGNPVVGTVLGGAVLDVLTLAGFKDYKQVKAQGNSAGAELVWS